MARRHRETHRSARSGWLRAAVLGSNDAIVSTASLMMGVAAADASEGRDPRRRRRRPVRRRDVDGRRRVRLGQLAARRRARRHRASRRKSSRRARSRAARARGHLLAARSRQAARDAGREAAHARTIGSARTCATSSASRSRLARVRCRPRGSRRSASRCSRCCRCSRSWSRRRSCACEMIAAVTLVEPRRPRRARRPARWCPDAARVRCASPSAARSRWR